MKDIIQFYGAEWCPDCSRAKSFLNQHNIEFEYIDISIKEDAAKKVESINNGNRIIPTIMVMEKQLTNPSNDELAGALGLNKKYRVVVFSADWCPDCKRAKSFLKQNRIHFMNIDVDEHQWATSKVESINNGKRIIPTLLINDEPLTNPDNTKLREMLSIEQEVESTVFDVAIIGAGAAGLTTAIYTQREKLSTVVLEKKNVGGNTFLTKEIANYPGFSNISGPDLMDKMKEQAEMYGVKIWEGIEVKEINKHSDEFELKTNDLPFRARSVVVTVGSTYRTLKIPEEKNLIGAGIHFCATCDGPFYREKKIIVIGGGNTALEEGMYLSEFCESVTIVHRKPNFSASQTYIDKLDDRENVTTLMNKTSIKFIANDQDTFEALVIEDNETKEQTKLIADGVFIFIGLKPNTAFLQDFVELDDAGFVVSEPDSAVTNIPGLFVAGDCRKNAIAQVAAATGEGVLASYNVKSYLRNQK